MTRIGGASIPENDAEGVDYSLDTAGAEKAKLVAWGPAAHGSVPVPQSCEKLFGEHH